MAIYRKIHTSFWSDPFTSELEADKKLFYLYLLTNEKTKQCGIYEISKKQICFDLGYSIDKVCKLLEYFIKIGKIKYSEQTNEVAIKNWTKYNYSTSPKVITCIQSELKLVKNRVLIEYINSIDTESQEEEEEEETKENTLTSESDSIDFEKLQKYWNGMTEKTLIPKIQIFSEQRKKRVNWLIKTYGRKEFEKAIKNLFESDFCTGKNGNWKADFDFLCQQSSFVKLIEGSYSNNKPTQQTQSNVSPPSQYKRHE